jgi:4-amino-4-deoxy-L-arabinose transferase-like glycosyltransferase
MKKCWKKYNPCLFPFKKAPFVIFMLFFITRWIYQWVTGNDHFSLFWDSYRYDALSEQILSGNFNLDIVAFIVAPLYPWLLAVVKFVSGEYWMIVASLIQYFFVALSGVYLFKLTRELFKSKKIGWIAAIFYCFYPMTLYYNALFTQETLFQSFFLLFLYQWRKAIKGEGNHASNKAGIWFALSFLTKSHAIILAPFILCIHFFYTHGKLVDRIKPALIIGTWAFILNLPFALINLQLNKVWTWSSYGSQTFFHNAHSPETFETSFHPKFENEDSRTASGGVGLDFIFDTAYVYPYYGKVNLLKQPERDKMHGKIALEWIRGHSSEFLMLKWFSLKRFLLPGVSKAHYRADIWLASLLATLPFYLLGYFGLFRALRENFTEHVWALSIVVLMFIVYMVFLPQARFRSVTLDPVYLIYAAYGFTILGQRFLPASISQYLHD